MSLTTDHLLQVKREIHDSRGGLSTVIPIAGVTIGVTADTYSSGVTLGTGNAVAIECLLSPNGTGVLQSIVIGDSAKQSGAIDVVVFNDNPSASTLTNNATTAIPAADLVKIIGHVSITSSDYIPFSATSVATKTNLGIVLKNLNTTDGQKAKIWLVFISRGTKTYTASCISANVGILQDA